MTRQRYRENAGARLASQVNDYASAERFLGDKPARKIANNTYIVRDGLDTINGVLHHSAIITWARDGRVRLDSHGYRTVTTKARLNTFLEGTPWRVIQERREWYVWNHRTGAKLPFEDGDWYDLAGVNPRARTIPTRIPQLIREGFPDGHGQAGAIAYREARARGDINPDADLLRRMRFFQEHAGYVVGKRAEGALDLARAERAASAMGWEAQWEPDPDPDLSWMDAREREQEHEVEVAVLYDQSGNAVASLGGIVDADNAYRRVVNAELALEAGAWDVFHSVTGEGD